MRCERHDDTRMKDSRSSTSGSVKDAIGANRGLATNIKMEDDGLSGVIRRTVTRSREQWAEGSIETRMGLLGVRTVVTRTEEGRRLRMIVNTSP